MNRVLFAVLTVLLASGFSQTNNTSVPLVRNEEDANKFIAGSTLQECQAHFHQCSHDLSEIRAWADLNYPIGQRLEVENEQLRRQATKTDMVRVFIVIAALGFGVFMAWAALKAICRWWPISKQRRQLITLLLMATWVTVAAFVAAAGDAKPSFHPVNLVLTVFVYSLPALAFGWIGVWWFGRTKPEVMW
jgi:hypothetical protein